MPEKKKQDEYVREKASAVQTKEGVRTILRRHIRMYLCSHDQGHFPTNLYNHVIHECERALVSEVLDFTQGNRLKAAKILGIHRNTLRKKTEILSS